MKVNFPNCYIYEDENTCIRCEYGYGFDENKHCQKCVDGCINCSLNYQICYECQVDDYYYHNNSCYKCPNNCSDCYFDDNEELKCLICHINFGLDENRECKECNVANCSDCSYDYTECNNCKYGFQLDIKNNICLDHCINQFCSVCDSKNANKCYSCKDYSYYIYQDCNECPPHCKRCNDNSCTSCDDGYVVVDGECKECMALFCSKCKTGDNNYCEICHVGFVAIDGKCIFCEDGF